MVIMDNTIEFFRRLVEADDGPEETPEQLKQWRKEMKKAQRRSNRLWAKACAPLDEPKMQELTWVVDGITYGLEDNEDMIDVHVGRLHDMHGFGNIKYNIRTLK